MTDREICEKIIEWEGSCVSDDFDFTCECCPIETECTEAYSNRNECSIDDGKIKNTLAKKYLADHPADNEWKPLEVDNLPRDIFKQNKEGQPIYEYEVFILDAWKWIEYIHTRIYDLVGGYDEHKYRYRKRQPEAPSHEEVAVEKLSEMSIETFWGLNQWDTYKMGFVDGRKSMEEK